MRNILTPLLLCGACLPGSVALAQAAPSASAQPETSETETQPLIERGETSSTCLAQQKGLEAELAAIDKMTSGGAEEEAAKPKKKSKIEEVAKAVAGAAVSVLLPPAAAVIEAADAAAEKDDGEDEKADTKKSGEAPAEQADPTPAAPAAEIPALLTRRQEIERRLTAVKQGSCTP